MTTTHNQGGNAKELIQTDPMILWNGFSGPVEIAGMRFRVTKKIMGDNNEVKIVHVFAAPFGTSLHGLGGSEVYVTLAQLHFQEFQSRLREGSRKWLEQKRIWEFLHDIFVAEGIKMKPQARSTSPLKATHEQHRKPEMKTSASIEDFALGALGVYCFDGSSPQAVFRVKPSQSQFGAGRQVPIAELISVEAGHPLHMYCRLGSFLYHNTLSQKNIPDFKGPRAGDLQKMWEFLTDMLADYRQAQPATAMQPPAPRSTRVDYHGNA